MKSSVYIFIILLLSSYVVSANGFETDFGQDNDTINQKIDGKKEGYWIIYAHMRDFSGYKPNDVVEEGRYKTNRKYGLWKKYFPNGNLMSEIYFKNGRANGGFKTYYENGNLEEAGIWKGRVYTGDFKRYHENGTIAQEKKFNEAGKTDGEVKYFYENGQEELVFTTVNGIENGKATRYYPNGDVKEVLIFDESGTVTKREEKARVNPPINEKKEEKGEGLKVAGNENMGGSKIIDGYHKTYNDDKDILMDGEFKNGKLIDGKHYIYDEYGLLERIEVYKNGKYVGNGVL